MNRRRLLLAAGSGLLLSQAGLPLSARAAEGTDRKAAGAAHGPHAAATPTAGKSATAGTSHAASRAASRPLRVGFLYDGPIDPYSASHLHALSAQYLKRQLGNRIELVPAERVTEGKDADRVLRKMCADGCQLVFGTAYGFMDAIVRVARDYPSVRFESNAGFKTADNVGTYNARYYQARYLAGMLAAHASKAGVLAYIAPVPVPEVLQGINAYTLGARSVNPKITVRVYWTNNWRDPGLEREATYSLLSQGADVFTQHTDTVAVAEVARDRKLKLIGFQGDYSKIVPRNLLLGTVLPNWNAYYLERTRKLLEGKWEPDHTWGGLADGMVQLELGPAPVSQAVRRQINAVRLQLMRGHRHVFEGELRANDGKVRQLGGVMSDTVMQKMDWLAEGVIGRVS
ncbi:MAG: BMP family ABC transporter substrate-binding protein [Lautropia mirabilis]|nr:BMP family ABC transporter substrate-binding protein [Lautropia mirabilis]